MKDSDGSISKMKYNENGCTNRINFQELPEKDRDTIRTVLYIMDRYCVSDSAYHEMTVIIDGLPRSYLVKQCRKSLSSTCHITRTPGKQPAAQMSLKEELQEQIKKKVCGQNITVKLAH